MLQSHRSPCVSFSRRGAGLCIYHLFGWSNLNFFHISQWITLPTQSYLVLYSFCANLLHSLIMWLIVSSLSPHNLHLLFCCILSVLALICRFSIVFFYVVLESLYRCVNAVFSASKSSSYSLWTLSLGCNALCIVISCLVLWSICLKSFWSTSKRVLLLLFTH